MAKKIDLLGRIITELERVQLAPPERRKDSGMLSLPPVLPLPDGTSLAASEAMMADISSYASLLFDNDRNIATTVSRKEMNKVTLRAFGQALAPIDLNAALQDNIADVLVKVGEFAAAEVNQIRPMRDLVFGCSLFSGGTASDPRVGPVRFERREPWLDRMRTEGRISEIVHRRVARRWERSFLRKRKPSHDEMVEREIIDTVSECRFVCSVACNGLAPAVAEQKGLLVARLALATVAMIWMRPSRILEALYLDYDGPHAHRHYVQFDRKGWRGGSSSRTRHPGGQYVDGDWDAIWADASWFVETVGHVLTAYIDPAATSPRPKLSNALFMSLWWFHEACREPSALMATVKFGASLDALAGGGKRRGIRELIEARTGMAPGAALTTKGQHTDEVVGRIYDAIRSQTLHGTNDRPGDDYSNTRDLAEEIARISLRLCCRWVYENPHAPDDVGALKRR